MRSKREREIINLLNRYQFIDFAIAVAVPRAGKKDHLRAYLNRRKGTWASYQGFRSQIGNIMGVQRGLDPSGPMQWSDVKESLKLVCSKKDLPTNTDVAKVMFDFVRQKGWSAYDDHHHNPLKFGAEREVPLKIQHYIVDGDRGAFQFVYPRSSELEPDQLLICQSIIYYHHVYEDADFGNFDVEFLDLSRPAMVGPKGGRTFAPNRQPRIRRLSREDLVDLDHLNEEANIIYRYLMELMHETD